MLTVALVVTPAMCVTDDNTVSEILGTIFFVSGLVTLLQSAFGIRYCFSLRNSTKLSTDYACQATTVREACWTNEGGSGVTRPSITEYLRERRGGLPQTDGGGHTATQQ
jgi:hypothetical protein